MCLNEREKDRASSVWVCGCSCRAQRSCRMTAIELRARLAAIVSQQLPLPGGGRTSERLRLLAETAREDLSVAQLAEAHWDAVAILAEAGRYPEPDVGYAGWASEILGQALQLERTSGGYQLSGSKPFCSGIGMVDRALVTVGLPEQLLVDVDLRKNEDRIDADLETWKV